MLRLSRIRLMLFFVLVVLMCSMVEGRAWPGKAAGENPDCGVSLDAGEEGTYYINEDLSCTSYDGSAIRIKTNDVTINCLDKNKITAQDASDERWRPIYIEGNLNNIVIKNCELVGDDGIRIEDSSTITNLQIKNNIITVSDDGIKSQNLINAEIINNQITAGDDGIRFNIAEDTKIKDNIISATGEAIYGKSNNDVNTELIISGNDIDSDGIGINIQSTVGSGSRINYNDITSTNDAINIDDRFENAEIKSNIIDSSDGSGIDIRERMVNGVIESNMISSDISGVAIAYDSPTSESSGNILNNEFTNSDRGVGFAGKTDSVKINQNIFDSVSNGILLSKDNNDLLIAGNIFLDNSRGIDLEIEGYSTTLKIDNNIFEDTNEGIFFQGNISGAIIRDNNFSNVATSGIKWGSGESEASDVVINNNYFCCSEAGYLIQMSGYEGVHTNNKISNNFFKNIEGTWTPILIGSQSHAIIVGNEFYNEEGYYLDNTVYYISNLEETTFSRNIVRGNVREAIQLNHDMGTTTMEDNYFCYSEDFDVNCRSTSPEPEIVNRNFFDVLYRDSESSCPEDSSTLLASRHSCYEQNACNDGLDNDLDNLIDGFDPDCEGKTCAEDSVWFGGVCTYTEYNPLAPVVFFTEELRNFQSYNDFLLYLNSAKVIKGENNPNLEQEYNGVCDDFCASLGGACLFADAGRNTCSRESSTKCTCHNIIGATS